MKLILFSLFIFAGSFSQAGEVLSCERVSMNGSKFVGSFDELMEVEIFSDRILITMELGQKVYPKDPIKARVVGFESQAYAQYIEGYFGSFKRGTIYVGEGENFGEIYMSSTSSGRTYNTTGGNAVYSCSAL